MRYVASLLLIAGALIAASSASASPQVVKPVTLTIYVGKHGVAGGPKKFTVHKNAHVVLVVHSTIGEAVHLHGYDIEKSIREQDRAGTDAVRREGDRRLRDRAAPDRDPRPQNRVADGEMSLGSRPRDRGDPQPPDPALRLLLRGGRGAGRLLRRPVVPLAEARPRRDGVTGARCPKAWVACSALPLAPGHGRGALGLPARFSLARRAWSARTTSGVNFTPTFVYVFFWVGMPIVSAVFGNVWSVLSTRGGGGGGGRAGLQPARLRDAPPFEYPERLGRWPAAVLLLSFAAMELTRTRIPSDPARSRARDRRSTA